VLAHSSTGYAQSHYKGQIDLLTVLDFGDLDSVELIKHGFCLTHCILDCGLLAIASLDKIYLLGEDKLSRQWRLLHTIPNAMRGMDVALIKNLKLVSIGEQR